MFRRKHLIQKRNSTGTEMTKLDGHNGNETKGNNYDYAVKISGDANGANRSDIGNYEYSEVTVEGDYSFSDLDNRVYISKPVEDPHTEQIDMYDTVEHETNKDYDYAENKGDSSYSYVDTNILQAVTKQHYQNKENAESYDQLFDKDNETKTLNAEINGYDSNVRLLSSGLDTNGSTSNINDKHAEGGQYQTSSNLKMEGQYDAFEKVSNGELSDYHIGSHLTSSALKDEGQYDIFEQSSNIESNDYSLGARRLSVELYDSCSNHNNSPHVINHYDINAIEGDKGDYDTFAQTPKDDQDLYDHTIVSDGTQIII